MAFWRRGRDAPLPSPVRTRRPVGTPDAIEPHLRPAVLAVVQRLVERDYTGALALTPERIALDYLAECMEQTGETFLTPQADHLDFGFQYGTGPHAELRVPLWTADGISDLEVQFQVGLDGELVLWNVLVP